MTAAGTTFVQLVSAILERFYRQNERPAPPAGEIAGLAGRLWALVEERGLPRPLAPAERGAPGEMPDAAVTPLVERTLAGAAAAWRGALEVPARQLVKACFYPEFKTCRDSFREVSPDGTCRRQELARARGRVSGVHCVDCPYWVALTPEQHGKLLTREWQPAGVAGWEAHRAVFLPEDFRALRLCLHRQARAGV
jgi:hypothetical protein